MSVQSVTLTGSGLTGVGPFNIAVAGGRAPPPLPPEVKLGRRPLAAGTKTVSLSDHWIPEFMSAEPPDAVDYTPKAMSSLSRVYLNDRYGDCVIAGKMHAMGVWSGNDPDGPGVVLATDDEVYSQYQRICGPGDNGCVITQVLDVMKSRGMTAGGKTFKIDGYASVDWTNPRLVKVVQYLFGATTIGINLPSAWTGSSVWDVTNTPIVGGHDVTPVGYDPKGVYVASWGRVYLITWAAFTSRRWLEEMYAVLSPLWYNDDQLSPLGINAGTLKAALDQIGQGQTPPIPDPNPPPEPPPEPPPGPLPQYPMYNVTLSGKIGPGGRVATLTGNAIPALVMPVDLESVEILVADTKLLNRLLQILGAGGIGEWTATGDKLLGRVNDYVPERFTALAKCVESMVNTLASKAHGE